MSRHGRAQRNSYAYDGRTGFKERANRLREDGELPGVWTTDPDDRHPLRYVRKVGPDGQRRRPEGHDRLDSIPAVIDLGYVMGEDLLPAQPPQLKLDSGGLLRIQVEVG